MNIKQPIARTNLSFTPLIQADQVDVRKNTFQKIYIYIVSHRQDMNFASLTLDSRIMRMKQRE